MRCLRSIGLWLYRTDHANDDEEEETHSSLREKEFDDDGIFGNGIESYSDEIIVKNVINKIVNSIEVEEETALKNVYFIDKFMTGSSNDASKNNSLIPVYDTQRNYTAVASKKRKINEVSFSEVNENLTTLGERENRKKKFDPINEHFTWCPWLKTSTYKVQSLNCENMNACQISFELVQQNLLKQKQKDDTKENSIMTKSNVNTTSNNLTTDAFLEKVKSAQSILIDCTSQLLSK
jgi:hypothetical protein